MIALRSSWQSSQMSHQLSSLLYWEEMVMDEDRIAGAAKDIRGSIEETIGEAVANTKLHLMVGRPGCG